MQADWQEVGCLHSGCFAALGCAGFFGLRRFVADGRLLAPHCLAGFEPHRVARELSVHGAVLVLLALFVLVEDGRHEVGFPHGAGLVLIVVVGVCALGALVVARRWNRQPHPLDGPV